MTIQTKSAKPTVKVFFDNKRGTRVTERTFHTLFRDIDLSIIRSVELGLEPLFLAGVTGLAFGAFAFQFGDLLYPWEQFGFLMLCLLLLAGGGSLMSLTVGTLFSDKTVCWGPVWTILKVRKALNDARHVSDMERDAIALMTRR